MRTPNLRLDLLSRAAFGLALAAAAAACGNPMAAGDTHVEVSGSVEIDGQNLCGDAGAPVCFFQKYAGPLGCLLQPLPDGTACDDGDATDGPDTCIAGVCRGAAAGGGTADGGASSGERDGGSATGCSTGPMRCPAPMTVSLSPVDGTFTVPDFVQGRRGGAVVCGDFNHLLVAGGHLAQQPEAGARVRGESDVPITVTAIDANGVAGDSCTTVVTLRDETPPRVSLVLDVPPDGLPERTAPHVSTVSAIDESGPPPAHGFVVNAHSSPSDALAGDDFPAGLNCVQAWATDAAGNRGVSAPTCFVSRDTVIHDLDLSVFAWSCTDSPQGADLKVSLVASAVSAEPALPPPFSMLDVVPTLVVLGGLDPHGFPLQTAAITPDGADSSDDSVEGVVANERQVQLTFHVSATLGDGVSRMSACPSALTLSLMAVSQGWLMTAQARVATPLAPLHTEFEGGGSGLRADLAPPVVLARGAGRAEPRQPPDHDRDRPPAAPAPQTGAPPGEACRCELLRDYGPAETGNESDQDCGGPDSCSVERTGNWDIRKAEYRSVSSVSSVSGGGSCHGASSAAYARMVGTVACTPSPCPTCCASPTILCRAQSSVSLDVDASGGASSRAALSHDVAGCTTLHNALGASTGQVSSALDLEGVVTVTSRQYSAALFHMDLSEEPPGGLVRSTQSAGTASACLGVVVSSAVFAGELCDGGNDDTAWYQRASQSMETTSTRTSIEAFCGGASVGSIEMH